MKRFIFLIPLLLCFSTKTFAAVNVFACEPEWKYLAEAIGGKYVKAYSATNAFQDPHHIEARPSLIAKTRRADLLVCTGAELEIGWLPLLLRQSGNAKIQEDQPGYFLAASQVERIEVPSKLDRSDGDVHASGNPHVHWDPYRVIKIAKALSQRLQIIDSKNANSYKQLHAQFENNWKQAIKGWEQQARALRGKKVIVYHKNWSYLLNWLNIQEVADLEPKPGIPPTSKHLAKVLKNSRNQKPNYILMANYQSDKGAKWLINKTNMPLMKLPFTVGGSKQAISLETLYDEVLATLVKAN